MTTLYKKIDGDLYYFEVWQDSPTSAIIHQGKVGTQGAMATLKKGFFQDLGSKIDAEVKKFKKDGYDAIEIDAHFTLMIEYKVVDMGTEEDLEKRRRLQARMQETLGWPGLGFCDGGSVGGGTMEVCCFVVSFDIAKKVIIEDLKGTEFEDYLRIYDENAG